MKNSDTRFDTSSPDKQILALASLFETQFSIDWIQDLLHVKATIILCVFENAVTENILAKEGLGIFLFRDTKTKDQLRDTIPQKQRRDFRRKIAQLMINEAPDNEQAILAAAGQLLHIPNDAKGCEILLEAGDRHRQKGESENALQCYKKVILDLEDKHGRVQDLLYIKTVIGYSKDRLSITVPEVVFSLLEKALVRAQKINDKALESILLLHIAAVQYERVQYQSAQPYFFRGRELARTVNDPAVERTLDACSLVHYCYNGLFEKAVRKYEAIESGSSKKPPEHRLSLKMGILLGFCYAYIGQIPQSLGKLNQLRDNALALDDHDALTRASIYIAFALIMKNDLENADRQIRETFEAATKIDIITKSFANLLQARIHFEKKDYQRSSEYLKLALKGKSTYSFTSRGQLFEFCLAMERKTYPAIPGLSLQEEIQMAIDIGNVYYQGIAYRYLAIMQEDRNEPPETILKNLKTSLALLEKSGGQFEIARTKEALARYFFKHNDSVSAQKHIKDAAKIFQNYGNRQVSDDLAHLLGNIQIKENLVEEILNFGPEVVEIKDIKIVAQRIVSIIIRITQAERGAIFLYSGSSEHKDIELLAAKNLSEEDMEKPGFKISRQMILKSAQNCKEYLDTIDTDDTIKSRICVPLLRRGEAIGVLYHDNRLFQSTFKKQDLKILSYFASFAAIALDNAQAYEKIKSLNQRLSEEKNYLEEQQLEHLHFEDFVAASHEIKKVLTLVKRVAETEATVLILGETGVGKEMVARAIHQQSNRRDKPFIRVNCSAFPESLIASELFGHEKGSFTGAAKRRIGRFELADTGTLFLDEIGDISMDIQIRLLRVLQTKKFERVGSSQTISSDFRLLTATNRNLEKAVARGSFRQDLFYRLNVFPIYVPPLRERMDDVSPLAVYFLKKHSDKMSKSFKGISEKEMNRLLAYHWPGNVRELENVIERGVILNSSDPFTIPELSLDNSEAAGADDHITGSITLEEMERRFIFDTLEKTNWKIYGPTGAAQILGLHHSTLYSRMKKLGIQNPNKTKTA